MSVAPELLRKIVEAALMAAAKPLSISQLQALFDEEEVPSKEEFEAAFEDIQTDTTDRGFELVEVASGWRFQVKQGMAQWIGKLWEEKPKKYSRAMLETLALVAYRQPITRGDIEQIRGVAVSSDIMRSLLDRDWVKVVGHKDVPGRPAMYATTKDFLDYFNLKSLEQLPTLAEIRDLDSLNAELNLEINLPPIKASLELTDEQLSEESINRFAHDEAQQGSVDGSKPAEADANQNELPVDELDDDYNDDDEEDIDKGSSEDDFPEANAGVENLGEDDIVNDESIEIAGNDEIFDGNLPSEETQEKTQID
jgi:segregation and condensation protein B